MISHWSHFISCDLNLWTWINPLHFILRTICSIHISTLNASLIAFKLFFGRDHSAVIQLFRQCFCYSLRRSLVHVYTLNINRMLQHLDLIQLKSDMIFINWIEMFSLIRIEFLTLRRLCTFPPHSPNIYSKFVTKRTMQTTLTYAINTDSIRFNSIPL